MLSFSWAQSLFGAQQLMNLLQAPVSGARADKAAAGFDAVAYSAADQLAGILKDSFSVGDQLQRMTVDAAFNFLTQGGFNLNAPVRLTAALLRQSMDTVQFLFSPHALLLS